MKTSFLPALLPRSFAWLNIAVAAALAVLASPSSAQAQQNYQYQGPMPSGYDTGRAPSSSRSLYPSPQYSPYQQQNYQQPPKPKPKPAYNSDPYAQQGGSQPYNYPARSQPQMPPYQYAPKPSAPKNGNSSRQVSQPLRDNSSTHRDSGALAQEVADLKAKQRQIAQRLDALESKSPVGGAYKPSPPSETNYIKHKVQFGDSLQGIASKYGTTSSQIKSVNHLSSNLLEEGQILRIPTKSSGKGSDNTARVHSSGSSGTHIVQRGESLSAIAAKYNVSSSTLQKANNIRNPNLLVVGQKLSIPGRSGQTNSGPDTPKKSTIASKNKGDGSTYVSKSSKSKNSQPSTLMAPSASNTIITPKGARGVTSYRVEQGDTIESVARLFGTTASEIQHKNKLSTPTLPPVGEEIIVPQPGALSS